MYIVCVYIWYMYIVCVYMHVRDIDIHISVSGGKHMADNKLMEEGRRQGHTAANIFLRTQTHAHTHTCTHTMGLKTNANELYQSYEYLISYCKMCSLTMRIHVYAYICASIGA